MKLAEFLGHIDPIFFRIPAGELGIPTENEATQTKELFIQSVDDRKLEARYVLEILSDLALKNGLHKIPPPSRSGAAEIAASLVNEPEASDKTYADQETNRFIDLTANSFVAEFGIAAFLELIDPIFFVIPSKEVGLFSENSASDLKALFIKHVEINHLDDFVVLAMVTELGQKNGLHKVSQSQRDSISPYLGIDSSEGESRSLVRLHYIGMAVVGYIAFGFPAMFILGGAVPGAVALLSIVGAVIAVLLTKQYKKSKRKENSEPRIFAQSGPQSFPVNKSSSTHVESRSDKPLTPAPTCPECGDTSPEEATHCISCGNKLPEIICPNCQTENVSRAKFCMGCGQER